MLEQPKTFEDMLGLYILQVITLDEFKEWYDQELGDAFYRGWNDAQDNRE